MASPPIGQRADAAHSARRDHAGDAGEIGRVDPPAAGQAAGHQQVIADAVDRAVHSDEAARLGDVHQAGQRTAVGHVELGILADDRQAIDRHIGIERRRARRGQRHVEIARAGVRWRRPGSRSIRHEIRWRPAGRCRASDRGAASYPVRRPPDHIGRSGSCRYAYRSRRPVAYVVAIAAGRGVVADFAEFARRAVDAVAGILRHAVDQLTVLDRHVIGIEVRHPMRWIGPVAVARLGADIVIIVVRRDPVPEQIQRLIERGGAVAARRLRRDRSGRCRKAPRSPASANRCRPGSAARPNRPRR